MKLYLSAILGFLAIALPCLPATAQQKKAPAAPGNLEEDLKEFVETPALPGYEQVLAEKIRTRLASFSPETDSLDDIMVKVGSGTPSRLIAAPMDEPGYVVSNIMSGGYLQLQRLPQFALLPLFNELYSAQPVVIGTSSRKWIDGVVAGLSVHLQPGRLNSPNLENIENMYVDVGAESAGEARLAGADVLSPLAIEHKLYELAFGKLTAPAIGDRFGDAALVELLREVDPQKLRGTLTIAFVAEQWTGARGLERLLEKGRYDEMIYVGRLRPGGAIPGASEISRAPRREPGSGVLLGLQKSSGVLSGLDEQLKELAAKNQIPFAIDYSAPLLPPSYLAPPALPAQYAHLAIATAWPSTPAEMIDSSDIANLAVLLEEYAQGSSRRPTFPSVAALAPPAMPPILKAAPSPAWVLKELIETYGVSGHEGSVREMVKRLLPPWAKPETDDAGNLILHLGSGKPGMKTPRIFIVAHMDEIGFEVKSIARDGRLEVEWRGGGDLSFYAGHAAFVHTAEGIRPGVVELPDGWDQPGFKWSREREAKIRVDIGARTPEEAEGLGVKVGDFVTIPKKFRRLAGTRADGRSFDDRVGCAALISAAWGLGPDLKSRDVTFLWSTGEELLGLVGAAAAAKRLASEGRAPDYVFAVDTFVSSDSPLESKRFADAWPGRGFVVRAIDNSNIVPRVLVEKVVRLARENRIPVQYGVTGGGNDGAAFLRYGSIDVALGWPLRYSHSPGEVIDTRDLDALARIIATVSREW